MFEVLGGNSLQQFILTCEKEDQRLNRKIGIFFNAWLMERLPAQLVDMFHQGNENPFSLYVEVRRERVRFVVNVIDDSLANAFRDILFTPTMTSLKFKQLKDIVFKVVERSERHLSQATLSRIFYQDEENGRFNIQVITPTAFKSQGRYQYLPDLRLFFQSLMRQYNHWFEGQDHIDVELLDEICKRTQITGYRLHTERYEIHNAFLMGFCGNLVVQCRGTQTLKNYVQMLLIFAEFSGVGAKTSLGMGGIRLRERNEKQSGKKKD